MWRMLLVYCHPQLLLPSKHVIIASRHDKHLICLIDYLTWLVSC